MPFSSVSIIAFEQINVSWELNSSQTYWKEFYRKKTFHPIYFQQNFWMPQKVLSRLLRGFRNFFEALEKMLLINKFDPFSLNWGWRGVKLSNLFVQRQAINTFTFFEKFLP